MDTTTLVPQGARAVLAVPVVGVIVGPPLAFGQVNEIHLLRLSFFQEPEQSRLRDQLTSSFESWGFMQAVDLTLKDPQLLVVPLVDDQAKTIKQALVQCQIAMCVLKKKLCGFGHVRLVEWDRRNGVAVGAVGTDGVWRAMERPASFCPPAIVRQPPKDYWDWFLSITLRDGLSALGQALLAHLSWARDAEQSDNDSHRFAFMWIALESAMLDGERNEGCFVRRLGLLAAAPRGADSRIIMNSPAMKAVFDAQQNPHSNLWVSVIKEMYAYRCAIVHDGAMDATTVTLDPMKLDWFYHLTAHLSAVLERVIVEGMIAGLSTLEDLWNGFAIGYLYSAGSHFVKTGTFVDKVFIVHDWATTRLPDF
jgi:hypothetical protein